VFLHSNGSGSSECALSFVSHCRDPLRATAAVSFRPSQPRRTVKKNKTKQNKFHNNRMIRFRRCFYTTNAATASAATAATNLEIVKEINKKKEAKLNRVSFHLHSSVLSLSLCAS